MDATSDFSGYKLYYTSIDSLHATPDMTSRDLIKKLTLLELDNERLRIDLENSKSELNAKNAANEGLKNKITELYMETRISLQEKQKLHNFMIDIQNRLIAAENSTKWYQTQIYDVQASKKALKIEVDTYRIILEQKYQALVNINAKWKQLNEDYITVIQKHREEKDILQEEIELLKINNNSIKPQSSVPITTYKDITKELDRTEKELEDVRAELRSLEERLTNSEIEKATLKNAFDKQQNLLSSMEDRIQRCQSENIKLDNTIKQLHIELQKLTAENETQQMNLLLGMQEREQVEDAIEQLRSQLIKMLTQHKVLKSKNIKLDEKLNAMQDVYNENKRLKSLSCSANEYHVRKLNQETNRFRILCHEQHGPRIVNKDLKEELKSSNSRLSEDNLDEGYADGSILGIQLTNISSPPLLDPKLLNNINDILNETKHFWEPIQIELDKLYTKFENYNGVKIPRTSNSYNTISLNNTSLAF